MSSTVEAPPAYDNGIPMKSVWDESDKSTRTTVARSHHSEPTVNRCFLIFGLVCCTIFGKLALYYNREAESLYNARSYEAANEAGRKAKMCTAAAIIVGTLVLILAIVGFTVWLVFQFGV